MKRKGFTIVEMLIVVFIIGILATVACGQFFSLHEKAKIRKTKEQLTMLFRAIEAFGYERGTLPTAAEFNADNLTNFGARNDSFVCPKDQKAYLYDTTVAGKSWMDWYVKEKSSTDDSWANAVDTLIVKTDGNPFNDNGVARGFGIYRNSTIGKM